MSWFRRKKKKEEPKVKEFEFSTWEIPCFGDAYYYKVEASNRAEAFKKLVEYFYGENSNQIEIKSECRQIHYPRREVFVANGMPNWFARRIGGIAICPETGRNYHKELQKYCIDNNIKMKES